MTRTLNLQQLHEIRALGLLINCVFTLVSSAASTFQVDPKGYVAYCPCMGRFGNQADHFLGAFSFAKALDRTFIIPPWVEYRTHRPRSVQVPYNTYFKADLLSKYTRVITMEDFMEHLADKVWPPEQRVSICHSPRKYSEKHKENDCNAKDGNPFGPFWDTFNVDFKRSLFWRGLTLDMQHSPVDVAMWKERFPVSKVPVLAFTGAPATFPAKQSDLRLQKYIEWNDEMIDRRDKFIADHLGGSSAYVSIHLRNGIDWDNACRHATGSNPHLFASPQCLGYDNEHGTLTTELCNPTYSTIVTEVKDAVYRTGVKFVFVATDQNKILHTLRGDMNKIGVSVVWQDGQTADPHLDLAVMAQAKHFIGNCISSFTAFVKRERDAHSKPSTFFAFRSKQGSRSNEEL